MYKLEALLREHRAEVLDFIRRASAFLGASPEGLEKVLEKPVWDDYILEFSKEGICLYITLSREPEWARYVAVSKGATEVSSFVGKISREVNSHGLGKAISSKPKNPGAR